MRCSQILSFKVSALQGLKDGVPLSDDSLEDALVDVLVRFRFTDERFVGPEGIRTHQSCHGGLSIFSGQKLGPRGIGGVVVNWANTTSANWGARFISDAHLSCNEHARYCP